MQRPFEEQLGAVREGVLDRIVVKVLVDRIVAILPPAGGLGSFRPGILHPAAFVDIVDQEVAVAAAAGPQEGVEPVDLVEQIAPFAWVRRSKFLGCPPVHAVSPQHLDIADLSRLDAVEQLVAGYAMPAHEAHAHLEVALGGIVGQLQHLARARPVHGNRLLHEDVEPFLDRVGEVDPAECRRRGQDHDVARPQTIHGFPIRIEADEFVIVGYLNLVADLLSFEVLVTRVKVVGKDVRHRHQLGRALLDGKCVLRRTGTAAAASHQGELDRVVFAGMHGGNRHARQRRGHRHGARCLDHLAA